MKEYHVTVAFNAIVTISAESEEEAEEKAGNHAIVHKLLKIPGISYDGAYAFLNMRKPSRCESCGAIVEGSLILDNGEWVCGPCAVW